MDENLLMQLFSLAASEKWWLLTALIIGAIARLLKDERVLKDKLPSRARPLIVVGLGVAGAIVNKIAQGIPWKTALAGGLAAAGIAILGHVFGIEVLRNGRELFEPKPEADKKTSPPALAFALIFVGVVGTVGTACKGLTPEKIADGALDAAQIACIFQSDVTDDSTVAKLCNIAPRLIPLIRELISQREAAKRSGYRWSGGDAGVLDAAPEAGQ